MEPRCLVEAFRSLHTTEARQDALAALLAELSPYEWRALHALTAARAFHVDIIGKLPTELAAYIFSYLDTSTPYRLQLWHHVLQSLVVLKSNLDSWYRGTVDLQNADYASYRTKARTIDALRTCKPHTRFPIRLDYAFHGLVLTSDTLIWQPRAGNTYSRGICVFDLATWSLRTLAGEAREEVCSIAASDDIVALATFSKVCYVWELHGQVSKKFIIPSQYYFGAVTCRRRTVACAGSFVQHISVYIWDFDTQRGRSFQIDPSPTGLFFSPDIHGSKATLALLLQPDTSTIVVFAGFPRRCRGYPAALGYSRYTYDGTCLESSEMPEVPYIESFRLPQGGINFIPVDAQGRFALRVYAQFANPRPSPDVQLQFDEHLNKFVPIENPYSHQGMFTNSAVSWWKDTFYLYEGGKDGESKLRVSNSSGYMKTLTILENKSFPNSTTLTNEKYFIRNTDEGFCVYCFEENDLYPKESGSFFDVGSFEVGRGELAEIIEETEKSMLPQWTFDDMMDASLLSGTVQ